MVGVIIATHGEFAKGILQSASMVFGEQENIKACTLMPSEGPDDLKQKLETAINSFSDKENILFLVDLWGGTPFNQASSLLAGYEDKRAILTGLNLPMLIEVCSCATYMDSAQEIATQVLESGKDGVKICPETLMPKKSTTPTTQQMVDLPTSGRIEYVLARVDTRLLHGQVATAWTKATSPNRIIVVSDEVSKDNLRKKLIEQAAPPGVKANVIPISKLLQIAEDPRFGKTKALLLFENPQDVLRVVEGGVKLDEINIGSMAHTVGKVVVSKAISLDEKDIETYEKLKELGVKFDVRKVPNDSRANMDDYLKKAKLELSKK
ncbi:mannose/fructose/sorbose PTS transporter subunit IIA [[Clostridium] colinum]|uniref:mannose/fructose/sorbose PTS transporter subunit IIA n=1 Tax=[Clostridium] colinum TaxID=36835 RepID=UPI0020255A29|nr:mannose/fructose/sorbose PTS transporter subunit IIA [[Clostridium] colinum]